MARLPRLCPPGIPQHVIQRGNNRSICFASDEDFSAYAHWIKEYSQEYAVAVHAWVFMTNHVHLLVTPSNTRGVSAMMQALGRRYVRYFNHQYRRTGTLWEGRFKSGPVQSEKYLLQCYRYIELNPVRADMVNEPSAYAWSSYRCNGLGIESGLCTPHDEYLKLGKSQDNRLRAYRALFKAHVDGELLVQIRGSVNKGLALGSEHFKDEVERLYGRRVRPAKMGRPKKG
jgi:putative transposase